MTLLETINAIKAVAMAQPSVNMVVDNDIFRLNAMPDAKYGVFAYVQGQHSGNIESGEQNFRFTFIYADRLTEDFHNEVEVQSVGVDTLTNILRVLAENELVSGDWQVTTFNQRFADLCAGAFCEVTLYVPVETMCADLIQF